MQQFCIFVYENTASNKSLETEMRFLKGKSIDLYFRKEKSSKQQLISAILQLHLRGVFEDMLLADMCALIRLI